LQVFGDCWHNGEPGLMLKSAPSGTEDIKPVVNRQSNTEGKSE